ncbi:hypothetical protein, partial [uncultured Muribaculum sp.]|uniref:hypothetical protein n=1 Tax=uncultured Muribaculum sp. TaxID=1918613 RepID=UPI00265D4C06
VMEQSKNFPPANLTKISEPKVIIIEKLVTLQPNVVKHLTDKLVKRYGSGWGFSKLQHCLLAAYTF